MNRSYKVITASLFVFSILSITSAYLLSQERADLTMVARIRDEAFNRSQVMDFAWYLTDVIGSRLAGSSGMSRAQQWAKTKMDQIGLSNTAIEPWGEHGVNWDLEYVSLHMLEPSYQPLIGYPQAFTRGTDGTLTGELQRVSTSRAKRTSKSTAVNCKTRLCWLLPAVNTPPASKGTLSGMTRVL